MTNAKAYSDQIAEMTQRAEAAEKDAADMTEKAGKLLLRLTEAEKALAEARKDTERLEWWFKNSNHVVVDRGDGTVAMYCGQRVTPWFDTPRAALDAAKEGK